jgi:hypothetical protein
MKRGVLGRPALLIVLSASLAAGCATAPDSSAPTQVDSSLDLITQTGNRAARPTAQPETLAGDPYAKTAGGVERAPRAKNSVVRFVAPSESLPSATLSPAGSARRLAVVFVRDHLLVHDADALLELDALLGADEEIRAIRVVRFPQATDVGLEALAALAWREGPELLLVEVREGKRRRAYLLHTRTGGLLARFGGQESAKDLEVATGGPPDLIRRLGVAFVRLRR